MTYLIRVSSLNKSIMIKMLAHVIHLAAFVMISFSIKAQTGRVGINTSMPKAGLHVADSSVVFTVPPVVNLTTLPPIEGTGARMMWFSDRFAFRAGYVVADRWNRDS